MICLEIKDLKEKQLIYLLITKKNHLKHSLISLRSVRLLKFKSLLESQQLLPREVKIFLHLKKMKHQNTLASLSFLKTQGQIDWTTYLQLFLLNTPRVEVISTQNKPSTICPFTNMLAVGKNCSILISKQPLKSIQISKGLDNVRESSVISAFSPHLSCQRLITKPNRSFTAPVNL